MSPSGGPARVLSLGELADALRQAGHIYVSGGATEPTGTLIELSRAGALDGLVISTAVVPGIRGSVMARIRRHARLQVPLLSDDLRDDGELQHILHLPIHYSDYFQYLRTAPIRAALIGVAEPVAGVVSLGVTQDFAPALLDRPVALYGAVNRNLLRVRDGIEVPLERFSGFVSADAPLPELPTQQVSAAYEQIGCHVAALIENGDTIQAGIGRAPMATLRALRSHRRLAFHAGLTTGEALELLDAGVLTSITTNVAVGNGDFYRRIAEARQVRFRPVGDTHGPLTLGKLERLVTVNSAIEVDLLGQVGAEMVGGRQISGHGGIADFCRGAKSSPGGRSIIALPTVAHHGTTGRIVSSLAAGSVVSVGRADVDYVVTEYGIAELRHKDVDERALALIGVAAPAYRDELSRAWHRRRRQL